MFSRIFQIDFSEKVRYQGLYGEPKDHKEMSSTGSSRKAKAWRKKQQDLIDQGKLREAVQMDIDEAREKFGSKYDEAIEEMLDYITSIGY